MTPARKAALQWFHDRGEVLRLSMMWSDPSDNMITRMIADGQLQLVNGWYSLTDKGRRMLNGDLK